MSEEQYFDYYIKNLPVFERTAMFLTRDKDFSQEILQEAFMSGFKYCHTYKEPGRGTFKAWFNTVLKHKFYDLIKKQRKIVLNESIIETNFCAYNDAFFMPDSINPNRFSGSIRAAKPSDKQYLKELKAKRIEKYILSKLQEKLEKEAYKNAAPQRKIQRVIANRTLNLSKKNKGRFAKAIIDNQITHIEIIERQDPAITAKVLTIKHAQFDQIISLSIDDIMKFE